MSPSTEKLLIFLLTCPIWIFGIIGINSGLLGATLAEQFVKAIGKTKWWKIVLSIWLLVLIGFVGSFVLFILSLVQAVINAIQWFTKAQPTADDYIKLYWVGAEKHILYQQISAIVQKLGGVCK